MNKCETCGQEKPDVDKFYFNQAEKEAGIYTYLCGDCKESIEKSIDEVGFGYNPEADYDD